MATVGREPDVGSGARGDDGVVAPGQAQVVAVQLEPVAGVPAVAGAGGASFQGSSFLGRW
ncbi:tetrahydrodipicolinate N-succinyltransferase [Lipingzhangella halophila]|uniref:Tetrahydrodipicolinate N-succinyltransferase n=1 Tax=Lipingzhangella halophila TaxID=1783352 RepID=A0A7W7RGW8_9ACTN|nr:hypothetical protein [Lipingzhangella halophila]MBB4931744.1 tetrahydrodipicolinate N-succinyltransferase [Lipingzhangella halophila]